MKAENLYFEKGTQIGGRYRIICFLGRGGAGAVYLVQHMITEQLWAAKVIKNDAQSRRYREINAMKQLEHPSLPQVFDVLQTDGNVWLILEYIDGDCLTGMAGEKMDVSVFFLVAEQLAAVLCYLHTKKQPVFHLDIKPGNLMLTSSGRLVLIDFGAAIRPDETQERWTYFGTNGFAAPEQFIQGGRISAASDVYGAGATLYYLLYGRKWKRTEGGKEEWKQKSIGDGAFRAMRKTLSGISELFFWKLAVIKILKKCLSEKSEDRYRDGALFYHEVRRAKRIYSRKRRAVLLIIPIVLLSFSMFFLTTQVLPVWEDQQKESKQQIYQKVLDQSEKLGFVQAISCYEQAAELFPDDAGWAFACLNRISEDYQFTLEEEAALQKLIYGVASEKDGIRLEKLESNKAEYSLFCYRLGISYWYYYEGSGGKSAAVKWFERSMEEKKQEWSEMAEIHAKIGAYYETLGRRDENGKQTDILLYWNDLNNLGKMDGLNRESQVVRQQIAKEILSCVILYVNDLKTGGIELQEIQRMLSEVQGIAQQDDLEIQQQYEAASAAAERVFGESK